MQEFHKGTPDYKGLEEEITHRKADLNVKIQFQGKEFQQRQARIYYNVYQEISQATDYFCQQHGIDVVLRLKGDGVDPEQFESVGAFISKPVVWSPPGLDITDSILRELNRTAVNPSRLEATLGRQCRSTTIKRPNNVRAPLRRPLRRTKDGRRRGRSGFSFPL